MKETFGQRLARLRKEKGLTQEEVASRIVISPQAVSKWENGNSEPDLNTLNQLADIFGVSVDELLGRDKNKEVKEEQAHEEVVHETADEVVEEKPSNRKEGKPFWIITSIVAGLCLIGYILMGMLWTDQNMGWSMGWILLLFPIVVGSILNCIKDHRCTHFAYPILVVMAYCTLGFLGRYFGFEGWGFYWFLFLTIPAFYLIFGPIDRHVLKKRYPNHDDDDDVDDDDDKVNVQVDEDKDGKKKTIKIEINDDK